VAHPCTVDARREYRPSADDAFFRKPTFYGAGVRTFPLQVSKNAKIGLGRA